MTEPNREAVEAVAAKIRHDLKTRTFPPDPITGLGGMGLTEFDLAETALTFLRDAIHADGPEGDAEREALGLRLEDAPFGIINERRVVSEWQEVTP